MWIWNSWTPCTVHPVTTCYRHLGILYVKNIHSQSNTLWKHATINCNILWSPYNTNLNPILFQNQLDAPMYQIYFILEWHSTCSGWSFHPSSGVQDCTYCNRHLSNRYCCLLANVYPLASREQYLFDKCLLLYVQSWTPDDGRKDHPKHVECHSKIK